MKRRIYWNLQNEYGRFVLTWRDLWQWLRTDLGEMGLIETWRYHWGIRPVLLTDAEYDAIPEANL